MSQPKDMADAEIAEMLGFYRAAAMRADQRQTAGYACQQTEQTQYVPAGSQGAPRSQLRVTIGRVAHPWACS